MSTNVMFSLFDDRFKQQRDLIANPVQTLASISTAPEDQSFAIRKMYGMEKTIPLVDYSDFSNFVFFNSAYDYFNITGEKILNEYPYDGSRDRTQAYLDDLDDYQRYVVSVWPSHIGCLLFNPTVSSSVVVVNDLGYDEGMLGNMAQTGMLSPTTSSWTVEMWCVPPPALTGSNAAMFAVQKVTGSGDGYSVFFSGSSLFFTMHSASAKDMISVPTVPGQLSYFAWTTDKDAQLVTAYTGSYNQFPVAVVSASTNMGTYANSTNCGTVPLYMGSGTLAGQTTLAFTGSIDDVRIWNIARQLSDLSSSFNVKIFAQRNLQGIWRFNETGSIPNSTAVVLDSSGHKLNGVIGNYFPTIRGSGSLLPFDQPDLVLNYYEPSVYNYIVAQQLSGTLYDRSNDNHIIELLPDQFFQLEEIAGTQILQNFLYILARQFDYVKVRIDQFVNVLSNNYTSFDKTPDSLLEDVGRFFGWEFTGNFLSVSAFQYLLGKQVLANMDSNRDLDVKLYQIRNEFWRRTLINLIHIYKTKGTRESVESLFRVYGVNQNFVRLKEYGLKANAGISTFRIASNKSVNALAFGSASYNNAYVVSNPFTGSAYSVECRVMFPTTASYDLPATLVTGSLWTINSSSAGGGILQQLTYVRQAAYSSTGSLFFQSVNGNLTASNVNIFDEKWYNIAVVQNVESGSITLNIRQLDTYTGDEITSYLTSSGPFVSASNSNQTPPSILWVGATGSLQAQYWLQEVRVWEDALTSGELDDHTLNFQSFGTEQVYPGVADLDLQWRLNEGLSSSLGGNFVGQVLDISGHNVSGSGYGFLPTWNNYKRFLNYYNYVAPPDLGWNEEKIRVYPATFVQPQDAFSDNRMIGLEFSMVDALNEDISQMLSTLDSFNNSIGLPSNRYREGYQDIRALRDLYFKRLQGRLNFRVFADMLAFFDRSFVDLVRRLIPARAIFLGDEFIVESHMLERPKLQWQYHRQPQPFQFEGVIQVFYR
jgi:hypothetical protein